jgi:hypothetical protein
MPSSLPVSAQTLWGDYQYYLAKTGHFQKKKKASSFIRLPKANPQRLALMDRMRLWCQNREIPARQWLFSLFAVRRWLFPPQLRPEDLCSEKHLARFDGFDDYRLYTERLRSEEQARATQFGVSSGFDPNRDLSSTAEQAKSYYVSSGRTAECIKQIHTETFGFHPKSSVCTKTCPSSELCIATLQSVVTFDIMALRRGEITSKQAYAQAVLSKQGYGRGRT